MDELSIRKQQLRAMHSAITEAMQSNTPTKETIYAFYEKKLSQAVDFGPLPSDYWERWHDSLYDDLAKADTTP